MPSNRVCFDARDIDRIVFTMPQAEILKEIRLAAIILSDETSDEVKFYWQDKSNAYKLAFAIAQWYGKDLITPELTLQAENAALRQKLYNKITTQTKPNRGLHGGVKL